jgi:hypothetical protein
MSPFAALSSHSAHGRRFCARCAARAPRAGFFVVPMTAAGGARRIALACAGDP